MTLPPDALPDRPMPTGAGPDCDCPACKAAKARGLIPTTTPEESRR